MHTNCTVIDLKGEFQISKTNIDTKNTSEVNEFIESLPGGSLLVFYPKTKAQKTIIMCPGGGLLKINLMHEGCDFIGWFNQQNINYAVLKYHLPAESHFATINDASLAIQAIRDRKSVV